MGNNEIIDVDVAIIGGGIAGISLAAMLPGGKKTVVIEQESQPGYHATGRSAALYSDTYGSPTVRALSRATFPFLAAPPQGFTDYPLLTPRGIILIGREDQRDALQRFATIPDIAPRVKTLNSAEVRARVPILREDHVAAGLLAESTFEVDVHALQNGFLRQARAAGVMIATDTPVLSLDRVGEKWLVRTTKTTFRSPIVVNAAGAWVEEVAAMAGAASLGITPYLRTAVMIDPPENVTIDSWPMVVDIDETFYFKPDAGRLLISPADEDPSEPCDAQPDEYNVAVAVDRIETATTLSVRRIHSKWAGLRTFAPDQEPVVGFDTECRGFFWLAGQGGYGIQTSHAIARLAAALLDEAPIPAELESEGFDIRTVSPARFEATDS